MRVIRSVAAARRMLPFRAIVRGCGLRGRLLNRNSLRPRPAAPIDVRPVTGRFTKSKLNKYN